MTGCEHRIIGAVFAALAFVTPRAGYCAGLTGAQRSLAGVKLLTIRVNCSDLARELGLEEKMLQSDIGKQLEGAGIGVARDQIWATLPGRCRFIATINISKPRHLDTLMYNLTGEFVFDPDLHPWNAQLFSKVNLHGPDQQKLNAVCDETTPESEVVLCTGQILAPKG